jgi:hypothetical protein
MLFDESVAARYDQFCQTAIGAYVDQAERALLWPLLALAPNMSVVDLGCGREPMPSRWRMRAVTLPELTSHRRFWPLPVSNALAKAWCGG